ncbi:MULTISPECIES: DUF4136 domain-containing protein [Shewanella]|uniref:DUF4136 domain-containing protein n=1 Tax=Shewanella marisflavi TaxID=260364 RepID=A0ABX5WLX4_9GAMM|nr:MULTISPECIES: DUF4136 domain-containing protein [Shewanella]QDF75588.1 DUF4136 domain-containing protein [Shewanella marisflavi]
MKTCLLSLILMMSVTACTVTEETPLQLPMTPEDRLTLVASGDLRFLGDQPSRFALHPDVAELRVGDEVQPDALKMRMREAIQAVMLAKGYQEVSMSQSPDLLIGYGVALGDKMSDSEILQKVGLVPGASNQGVDMGRYEKGTVLLMVFDPKLASPIWQVLAQGFTPLSQDNAQAKEGTDSRLSRVITKMLSELPQHL